MSRFYEALKQASRLSAAESTNAGEDTLPAFGIGNVPEVLPCPPPRAAENADPRTKPAPERPVDDDATRNALTDAKRGVWLLGPEEAPERKIPRLTQSGRAARITIDKQARVIPNVTDQAVIEHYRRLRTKLMQQHDTEPFRTLLVTSASPQEGKSVTVMNLALSFAMLPSFSVAVVDGDLRRGSLGQWLGLDDRPGLSDAIEGTASLEDIVFKSDDVPVHFIVRGTSKMPAAELLHSPRLGMQIEGMAKQFDLVLIDSPPINLITDTHILAANSDAVLLVARAFSTTCKSFDKAVQELSDRRIVGTVLNGGTRAQIHRRYNGYYY